VPTTTVTPAEEFAAAWERFFRTTRRLRARAGRAAVAGLSIAQYQLLEALRETDELTVGELADAAGVAAPTATRMLDGLARDGHVERVQSTADRRVVLVTLTPSGRVALEAAHRNATAFRRRVFERLPEDERPQATAVLARLSQVLEAELA
jgi:DNA-binding MarR family transcriptional regulator